MALKFKPQMQLMHDRDDVTEYAMQVDDELVEVSVTHSPRKVEEWITATEQRNHLRLHRLIVALEIHRRPATAPAPENPVAILQLVVNTRCLIYRIQKSETVPEGLKSFLKKNYTFVGVGIEGCKQKLFRDYGLEVTKTVDLSEMAAHELAEPDLRNVILQQLAMRFLRKYVDCEKLVSVRLSNWDRDTLSKEQVMFASLNGYVSFVIARMLQSWYD